MMILRRRRPPTLVAPSIILKRRQRQQGYGNDVGALLFSSLSSSSRPTKTRTKTDDDNPRIGSNGGCGSSIGRTSSYYSFMSTSAASYNCYRCDPTLVDASNAPRDFDPRTAVVYRDLIAPAEGETLASDLEAKFKRRRYEKGHWDAVIVKYKEIELPDHHHHHHHDHDDDGNDSLLSGTTLRVIERVRELLRTNHHHVAEQQQQQQQDKEGEGGAQKNIISWLPCHAIDLHEDGALHAHVDSVRFSGNLVSGLSLLSPSIMRLEPNSDEKQGDVDRENDGDSTPPPSSEDNDDQSKNDRHQYYVDLYLPPLSLYVLSGASRYDYTHRLLPTGSAFTFITGQGKKNKDHKEDVVVVERGRRLSVIFRDAKNNSNEHTSIT